MKKISITDFEFKVTGYGHYNVTYTSPVTGKQWTTGIDDDVLGYPFCAKFDKDIVFTDKPVKK